MFSSKVEALGEKAHDLAATATDDTKGGMSSGRQVADATVDRIADGMDQVSRSTAPVVKRVKRRAGVLLEQSGEMLGEASDRAIETATDISKSLVSYTKKNPITALLLVLGAGALLVSAAKSIRSQR
jgi:ElaB/YqjD/DUF883 family membrane-anchored ribosome-binding protein